MLRKVKNQKGFTLIELIVVIAILAILAAVAIPRLTGFQDSAKQKADIATGKTIATAAATLVADGKITVPQAGFLVNTSATAIAEADTDEPGEFVRNYMQSVPENMAGDQNWFVVITSSGDVSVYADDAAEAGNMVFPTAGGNYD